MKKAIYKSYGKKGEDIVNMNYAAVERGGQRRGQGGGSGRVGEFVVEGGRSTRPMPRVPNS